MRIGDPAQRRRKGALLDSHGASQIDKRPSLHFQQGALLPVIVYIFIVYRRYLKRRFISFRRENQRHAATPQPGIGPDVVGQSGKLFRRLAPRKHGYRLAAAPQQGGNAGVMRPEIAVGVVAAGGDHGVDGRRSVVQADRRGRVDFAQQPHDMFHQHGILGGGLHETTVAAHKHAQQVEKTNKRDISGHDDQHAPRLRNRKGRVVRQPRLELFALQHVAGDRAHRTTDVGGRKPAVGTAGGVNDRARRIVIAETEQARAQCGKCFDHVFHGYKDTISRCNPHIFPKVVLFLRKGIQ